MNLNATSAIDIGGMVVGRIFSVFGIYYLISNSMGLVEFRRS